MKTDKKIALVTGGMGGIGQAICKALHEKNMVVIATYYRGGDHSSAIAWQKAQKIAGYDFEIAFMNVTDFSSCESAINKIHAEIGTIDILVNNAGITRDHACSKMTKDDWDTVINTDLNSLFYLTRHVIDEMKNKQFGRIINMSSINAQKGQFGQVNYAAAKAGIHGFTKALALEVAKKGITVNTVSPGYVNTNMIKEIPPEIQQKILDEIPMGRFAEPDEIARIVAFLADEKSNYITGSNIVINGGHYML